MILIYTFVNAIMARALFRFRDNIMCAENISFSFCNAGVMYG